MIDRVVPHDTDAEEAVIGSLLIDGDLITTVRHKVAPSDFFTGPCQTMFSACLACFGRHEHIDQITVAQELDRKSQLESCGGAAYLSHLVAMVPYAGDIEHYAEIVKRLSVSRGLIQLSQKVCDIGFSADPDSNAAMNTVVDMAQSFRRNNVSFDSLVTPSQVSDKLFDMIQKYDGKMKGLSWGFLDMDDITMGMYPGEFIILGGRPSVGKTQIMLDIAEHQALAGKHVLFVSAEMSMDMILERKVARELEINVWNLRKKGLNGEQGGKVATLAGKVSEQQVYYLPEGVSSQDIYAEAQKLQETRGLDVVFVDYLGKLKDAYSGGGENTNARVGKVCKVLKDIANDRGIPVVVACQLNRSLEFRDDKRPMLADLRDSGNIEQDADVVFLLHRDPAAKDKLEVMMAKHRQIGSQSEPVILQWLDKERRYADATKNY